ncbi:hypothetical protein Tco_0132497 [Tanacetum coccineum]
MSESAKRHEENSNLIKEIRATTDAAIKNQGASIKTLEIQIGQMSKMVTRDNVVGALMIVLFLLEPISVIQLCHFGDMDAYRDEGNGRLDKKELNLDEYQLLKGSKKELLESMAHLHSRCEMEGMANRGTLACIEMDYIGS